MTVELETPYLLAVPPVEGEITGRMNGEKEREGEEKKEGREE